METSGTRGYLPAIICRARAPRDLGSSTDFEPGGKYAFEADVMPKACGTPDAGFPVTIVKESELPANNDIEQICGTDASGCRLAFDLGKSDVKTVAVHNNVVLYAKDTKWDVTNPDPDYHFKIICDELNKAKARDAHLSHEPCLKEKSWPVRAD